MTKSKELSILDGTNIPTLKNKSTDLLAILKSLLPTSFNSACTLAKQTEEQHEFSVVHYKDGKPLVRDPYGEAYTEAKYDNFFDAVIDATILGGYFADVNSPHYDKNPDNKQNDAELNDYMRSITRVVYHGGEKILEINVESPQEASWIASRLASEWLGNPDHPMHLPLHLHRTDGHYKEPQNVLNSQGDLTWSKNNRAAYAHRAYEENGDCRFHSSGAPMMCGGDSDYAAAIMLLAPNLEAVNEKLKKLGIEDKTLSRLPVLGMGDNIRRIKSQPSFSGLSPG
jgi:hypothetical protein